MVTFDRKRSSQLFSKKKISIRWKLIDREIKFVSIFSKNLQLELPSCVQLDWEYDSFSPHELRIDFIFICLIVEKQIFRQR